METEWRGVSSAISGTGTDPGFGIAACIEDTHGARNPVEGDQISFFSINHNRWLRGCVILCPNQVRPRALAATIPTWPIGARVYGIEWNSIRKDAESVIQAVALDGSTKWNLVGDVRKKAVLMKSGRLTGQ